jgi:hypothetical protein
MATPAMQKATHSPRERRDFIDGRRANLPPEEIRLDWSEGRIFGLFTGFLNTDTIRISEQRQLAGQSNLS